MQENKEYSFTIEAKLFGRYKTISVNVYQFGDIETCKKELNLLGDKLADTYDDMQEYENYYESKC